ncbi:hypothetical protein B0H63DRAFT_528802 [Podospora didyma]|uniref:ABC transporter domain-containing protein n=1 Tax=Podospora didyma TaxID=330526 RepID=A0AAE0K2G9_9PEZI|nr:hypothetical protein B0H63DRAFT_528802 [Podospora didyma]
MAERPFKKVTIVEAGPSGLLLAVLLGKHSIPGQILEASDHLDQSTTKYGATIEWEHKVVDIGQDADTAWVNIETPAGRKMIEGDYIVGADGANSQIRRSVFGDEFPGVIELAIASWLLYYQLGPAFLVPIVIFLICTGLTLGRGKFTGKPFRAAMQFLQKRVALSAAVTPDLVAIKASAMASGLAALIHGYRVKQIDAMRRFRILTTVSTVLTFAPNLLSPVVTFSTSMGNRTVASQPSPRSAELEFLESESHIGNRLPMGDSDGNADVGTTKSPAVINTNAPSIEAPDLIQVQQDTVTHVITTENCKLGWKNETWFLKNVKLCLPRATFTLLLGPVASGKSMLCKALLGEVPINLTIRESIMGGFGDVTSFNGPWYEDVVRACHVAQDFAFLPHGDQTRVGSKGSALSGGQRRRLALTRAIYARPELAVFDDPFGGIDSCKESLVARDVFGPEGILRRQNTTVLLTAQSARHLPFMDQVIILRDKGVVFQGPAGGMELKPELSPRDAAVSDLSSMSRDMDPAQAPEKKDHSVPSWGPCQPSILFLLDRYPPLALYLLLAACFFFLFNFSTVRLQFWAAANKNQDGQNRRTTSFYLGTYLGLQVVCLCMLALDVWLLGNVMGPKADLHLHFRTLRTLIRALLQFYSTVDSSVPTGYLSQDMGIVDNELNSSFGNTAAVIATESPYLLAGYPILLAVLFCVQKVYLRTSTQLRHLVLESKDPLHKHFIETVNGLVTIRAFG